MFRSRRLGAEGGFILAFFNSLFDLSSAVSNAAMGIVRHPPTPPQIDLLSSESSWKLALAPAFMVILALALWRSDRVFRARRLRVVVGLLVLTIVIYLVVRVFDTWAWLGFKAGNPFFTSVYGYILPVIPINATSFLALTALLTHMRRGSHPEEPVAH